MTSDLSIWNGDGLPEDDDEALDIFLDLFDFEIDEIIDACKRTAWVHEKTAAHEDYDANIAMARFFWRRTARWIELRKQYEQQMKDAHDTD